MGFTFRKSIKLPGGFRVNLSKGGVGVSAGIPGFRVGVGPKGGRVTAGIPGTGLGWTQSFPLGGARNESAARTAKRELAARDAGAAKMAARERAAHEVASFEAHLADLVSFHKTGWRRWDWAAIAAVPPPPAGSPDFARWQWFNSVARGVLSGEAAACQAVLDHLSPFAELGALGGGLDVAATAPWCVEGWLLASPPEVVPAEELSLTKTGKVSRKKMSATRSLSLYQDHVVSATFRVAREIFALLPIPVALVHAAVARLDTRTGHTENVPILSVAFDRATFEELNLDAIDPSDALEGFDHAMEFKKTTGFAPVKVIDKAELHVVE